MHLLLPLLLAAPSSTPPTFSSEFSLRYNVTNLQYGFVATGRWTVDHIDSLGIRNLRERLDADLPLHPTTQIKEYGAVHRMVSIDSSLAPPSHACSSAIPPNVTQAAWFVVAGSNDVNALNESVAIWREHHASANLCVDFFVTRKSSSSAKDVLPFRIEYRGNCSSATVRSPSEVIAQLNAYSSFSFVDADPKLFRPPPGTPPCPPTNQQSRLISGSVLRGLF